MMEPRMSDFTFFFFFLLSVSLYLDLALSLAFSLLFYLPKKGRVPRNYFNIGALAGQKKKKGARAATASPATVWVHYPKMRPITPPPLSQAPQLPQHRLPEYKRGEGRRQKGTRGRIGTGKREGVWVDGRLNRSREGWV